MFGFGKKHQVIAVEFYEAQSSQPLAASDMPIDQLPDTFQIRTTLNIQGEEWIVTSATPARKEEFRVTGKLQIHLEKPRPITSLPLGDILFSLPTISNDIAALQGADSLENILVVHEDDWRQQELVFGHDAEMHEEFAAIRNIYETRRSSSGAFHDLHVRKAIPAPLGDVQIPLGELTASLGVGHKYRGVGFDHVAGVIVKGFAFQSSAGWDVWGQCREEQTLDFVCFQRVNPNTTAAPLAFRSLLLNHNLRFVDWVRAFSTQFKEHC